MCHKNSVGFWKQDDLKNFTNKLTTKQLDCPGTPKKERSWQDEKMCVEGMRRKVSYRQLVSGNCLLDCKLYTSDSKHYAIAIKYHYIGAMEGIPENLSKNK